MFNIALGAMLAGALAGALAGLDVVRLIREPVAAALAYGLNLKEDQTEHEQRSWPWADGHIFVHRMYAAKYKRELLPELAA
eukprot:1144653-Pelagomonas_calceolata.AAC.2